MSRTRERIAWYRARMTKAARARDYIAEQVTSGRGDALTGSEVAEAIGADPSLGRRELRAMRNAGDCPRPRLPELAEVRRINVAVNSQMVVAIELLMANEEENLTEAVRRLCGYGDFVYRKVKVEGYRLYIERDGERRQIDLLL